MIILDSDVLITIIDKKTQLGDMILDYLEKHNEEKVTTALNLEEVLFGIFKRTGRKKLRNDHPILNFSILSFTKEDATLAAQIELEMEKKGKKKPRGDVLIAAIACRVGGKLFTLNNKHFRDIPKLKLLDLKK